MKIYRYLIGFAALALASCSSDSLDTLPDASVTLTAHIDGIDSDSTGYRFSGGQDVGVFLTSQGEGSSMMQADVLQNGRFSQSAAGLVCKPAVKWTAEQLNVMAYFPYNKEMGSQTDAYPFQVQIRQDSATLVNGRDCQSDLLWTRQTIQASTEACPVQFHHLLSKVLIELRTSSSRKGGLVDSRVSLENTRPSAIVNLSQGTVQTTGDRANITARSLAVIPEDCEGLYEAICIPQEVTEGTQFLRIETQGGQVYTWNASRLISLVSGKQITLEVTVDESDVDVVIRDIQDWDDNDQIIEGSTVEELPTYHLYDFYDRKGIQGIVVSIEDDGKHGWIMSTDQAVLTWTTDPSWQTKSPKAFDKDDADVNLAAALKQDESLDLFPAFQWCNNKNRGRVTGWVLPAKNVLEAAFSKIYNIETGTPDASGLEKFNATLKDCEVADSLKTYLPGMEDDYYLFLSSTLSQYTGLVYSVEGYPSAISYYGYEYFYYSSSKAPDEEGYVRAFHKF